MTTSFPEKTFEHWASQYITYRFRSHLGQWWPTKGADIQVEPSALSTGKAIWLELKTATPNVVHPHVHEVEIDVPQLRHYHSGSKPPVYYVVPQPGWEGTLGTAGSQAWMAGTARSDLAFRRSGGQWFGAWTRVIAGWSLHAALRRNGAERQKTAKLGSWDSKQRSWTWSQAFKPPRHAPHPEWQWPDFWRAWETCGSTVMPSAFVMPQTDATPRESSARSVSRPQLIERARDARVATGENSDSFGGLRGIYLPEFGASSRPTGRYRLSATVEAATTHPVEHWTGDGGRVELSMLATLAFDYIDF